MGTSVKAKAVINVAPEAVVTQEGNYIFVDLITEVKPNRLFMDTKTGEVFYGSPYREYIKVVCAKYVGAFMYHLINWERGKESLPLLYHYLMLKTK